MNVLFITTEIYPFLKVGGLGDVSGSLVPALRNKKIDARFLTIGHPNILAALKNIKSKTSIQVPFFISDTELSGAPKKVTLIEGEIGDANVPTFVIASKEFYERDGNPYIDEFGIDWSDNLERFATLGWVAAKITDTQWKPDILHANDWHAGLTPAYAKFFHNKKRPKTVFTIHNLSYPGIFPSFDFHKFNLPYDYFHVDGLEYYGKVSFLKSGLYYSDAITTVSQCYAEEITNSNEFGMGFEGLLQARKKDLTGILNGADYDEWSPMKDKFLKKKFSSKDFTNKYKLKEELIKKAGIACNDKTFLIGSVGRLVEQKGVNAIIEVVNYITRENINAVVAVVGTGNKHYENILKGIMESGSQHLIYYDVYDESVAHGVIAASDAILVPSLFEPCGLTQIYSMKYGTLPIVTPVGGLKDTVSNAKTGFVSKDTGIGSVIESVDTAIKTFSSDKTKWETMMQEAMGKRFSWTESATKYISLYKKLLSKKAK